VISVHVSHSLSVIEQGDLDVVTDATVDLFDGSNNLIETLTHTSDGYYKGTSIASIGDEYKLEISHPDYTTISSSTFVPGLASLVSIDTLGITTVDFKELEVTITIDDEVGEDYYLLELFLGDNVGSGTFKNPAYFRSNDISLNLSDEQYVFSRAFDDKLFDGNRKEIKVYMEDTRDYDAFLEVHISKVTQATYFYHNSFFGFVEADGNPFAQPVQVYSNVDEGFGILGGKNLSVKKVNY